MVKRVNVLGNGDYSVLFSKDDERTGLNVICNMPPFPIPASDVHATCMVDFKMMKALTEGSLNLDMYDWVLGVRPKKWMSMKPDFYMKHASHIKDFYLTVPKYAGNATNFNCGHMAVHYAANKMQADEVHMYGFDSLFDSSIRSVTDLYLQSDKGQNNSYRLMNIWRPLWLNLFSEFPNTTFVLHHIHGQLRLPNPPKNIQVCVHERTK